jgi:hypothetical protein
MALIGWHPWRAVTVDGVRDYFRYERRRHLD